MSRPSIQIFRSPRKALPRSAINHQSVTLLDSIEKRRFAKNLRNGASDRLPQKIVHPLSRRMICSSRCAIIERQAAPHPSRKTAVENLGILETCPTSAERRSCCKIHAAVVIKDHAMMSIARRPQNTEEMCGNGAAIRPGMTSQLKDRLASKHAVKSQKLSSGNMPPAVSPERIPSVNHA